MASICLRRLTCASNYRTLKHIYTFNNLTKISPVISSRNVTLIGNPDHYLLKPKIQPCSILRLYTKKVENEEKPRLIQRFKQMYRDYWYVLVPVHLVTSAAWFGGFYYLAESGVDIAGILENWNVNDKIIRTLRDSSMGYIAVAYALYKLATPLRYTVTLGGTTISINYLKRFGYIKPVPTTNQLKVMYQERKDNIIESFKETKEIYKEKKGNLLRDTKIELKMHKTQLKNQKNSLVEDIEKSLKKIKKPSKIEE